MKASEARRTRVLIVDDDRSQRLLPKRWLSALGYDVREAGDGREALALFESFEPDVVLLDAMMPHLDGFETARAMRQRAPADRLLQIMMITALEDEDSYVRGLEAGSDDFVSKPLSRTLLAARFRSFQRTRELYDAARHQARTLEAMAERTQHEQAMAARLMNKTLSSAFLERDEFAMSSRALEAFNGDLIMAAPSGSRRFRLLFADFAGHGIEAAVGSLPVAMRFQRACADDEPLQSFVNSTCIDLRSVIPRHRFMAAVIIDVDLDRRRARYVNAGMPDVVLVSGPRIRRLASTQPPLGVLEPPLDLDPIPEIELEPGELVYFHTDGLLETEDNSGRRFGLERLVDVLARCEGELSSVLEAVRCFGNGRAPQDDASLLRFRFSPEMDWGEVRPDRGRSCARFDGSLG